MTEISAKDFKRLIETGQITTNKKGKFIAPKLPEFYKEHLEKENEVSLDSGFIIPCKLITLNEYINIERSNRYKAAKVKKELTELCTKYAKCLAGKINPNLQYDVYCYWTTPNKRFDTDNISIGLKFLLDGMVKANVIKDDSYKHIRNIYHIRDIKKNTNQVKIILCTAQTAN